MKWFPCSVRSRANARSPNQRTAPVAAVLLLEYVLDAKGILNWAANAFGGSYVQLDAIYRAAAFGSEDHAFVVSGSVPVCRQQKHGLRADARFSASLMLHDLSLHFAA